MSKIVTSPAAAYLTSPNIVHPQSERGAPGETQVLAAEAAARTDITARFGITASAGAIKRGK